MPPKVLKDKALIARRPVLDDFKKFEMLAVLIRNKAAFLAVYDLLEVKHIEAIGVPHALIWKVVRKFYSKHTALPMREMLRTELHNELGGNDDLDEDERNELDAFVDYSFSKKRHGGKNLAKSKLYAETALDTCRQFLEEQFALDLRENIYSSGEVPVEMPTLLSEHTQRLTRLQSLTQPDIDRLFPKGWEQEAPPILKPTGVETLDLFMGGGIADDECLLFMGPYGSCKTTVAVQSGCQMAKAASNLYIGLKSKFGRRPVVVFISTEMGAREMRMRALAHLAQVPRKRIRKMLEDHRSLAPLSRSKKPGAFKETEYENKLFGTKESVGSYMCEADRVKYAMRTLNDHMLFLECTGSNMRNRNMGGGGIPEVASIVEAEMRKRKEIIPYAFVLDHASALVARMITGGKYTLDDERKLLKLMPQQCLEYLIEPHKAPLILMHQLSGEANSRAPTADLSHTDAAECKSIGEYAAFAVVTGNPTQDDNQLTKWRCTKHRREPPKPHAIVQIDGRFARVVDVSEDFTIDTASRTIVSKKEMSTLGQYNKAVKHGDDDVSGVTG